VVACRGGTFYSGQSFTTPSSGGPWDDITFNFYSDAPPTTPLAAGAAFLLNQAYSGAPADLSSSTTGFLAESTGITGGVYDFPIDLVLQPGTQYFLYEDAILGPSGGNVISGGVFYEATDAGADFAPFEGESANFTVSGDVASVVPEPSTWALMALGFGLLGGAGYWRRRSVAVAA
jgi:hypothetical protein